LVGIDAARNGAHLVHDDVPGNRVGVLEQRFGNADAALESAPNRLSLDVHIQRSGSTPLEGRGTVARWDEDLARLSVWTSTQNSTGVRAATAAKHGLDLGEADVAPPDVGGGPGRQSARPWPARPPRAHAGQAPGPAL